MNNKLLMIVALFICFGCQNKSYYEVMNVNQQRFGGTQLEDAQFLNESYDLILLLGNMSALAKKRSTLKETYLVSEEGAKIAKGLNVDYKVEAIRHRVKLTSNLSKTNDEYLHYLDKINEESFDLLYLQSMKAKLKELIAIMETYTTTGKSERLIELADEVQDSFRPINKSLSEIN